MKAAELDLTSFFVYACPRHGSIISDEEDPTCHMERLRIEQERRRGLARNWEAICPRALYKMDQQTEVFDSIPCPD